MKKRIQENLRFISGRVVCAAAVAAGLFLVLLACYLRQIGRCGAEWGPFVVVFAGFILLCMLCWQYIAKPYLRWKKQVNRFLDGYFPYELIREQETMLTPYTLREIQRVDEILNSTQMENLNKRQAQYLALQNQINPHFLYNTLEGIRSEALIAGVDEVAEMTEALATFFRYTISKDEKLVTVEEEIENCKTYFKIQQYRFGDRLNLHIEYDEDEWGELLRCRIPKLTLQPILENSIIHGTELKIGTGNHTIAVERTKERLLIRVSDNGVGMDEETLEKLNGRLGRTTNRLMDSVKGKKGGIALANVNNRIRLLFGEEYGIHVFSMEGVGTDVEITVPVVNSEREIRKPGTAG